MKKIKKFINTIDSNFITFSFISFLLIIITSLLLSGCYVNDTDNTDNKIHKINENNIQKGVWDNGVRDSIDTRKYYKITAMHSGKALDVEGLSLENGVNIQQWSYNSGKNQQWYFEPTGEAHTYYIRSRHSGKALDVLGWETAEKSNVGVWQLNNGAANQKWVIISGIGQNNIFIKSIHANKYLTVIDGPTNNGANIGVDIFRILPGQRPTTIHTHQRWIITEVADVDPNKKPIGTLEVEDATLQDGNISMAAEMGYGLTVDLGYQRKDIYWFGVDKNINYALPIQDTNSGNTTGMIINYNYNGSKWLYIKDFQQSDPIPMLTYMQNASGSGIDNWANGLEDTGKAYKLNSCHILLKGKGHIVSDILTGVVIENSHKYGASFNDEPYKMKWEDCNGNRIDAREKSLNYNGKRVDYSDVQVCFKGDTLVWMKNTIKKKIKDVKAGDKVYSYNIKKKKYQVRRVLKVTKKKVTEYVRLNISGETILVTKKHPFLTKAGQWVAASKLEVGQKLKGMNRTNTVNSVINGRAPSGMWVYNLEVDENKNYVVGNKKNIVHNQCAIDPSSLDKWISNDAKITIEYYTPAGVGAHLVVQPKQDPNLCSAQNPQGLYWQILEGGPGIGLGGQAGGTLGPLKLDIGLLASIKSIYIMNDDKWNPGPEQIGYEQKVFAGLDTLASLEIKLFQKFYDHDTTPDLLSELYVGGKLCVFGICGELVIKSDTFLEQNLPETNVKFNTYFEVPLTNCQWNTNTGWDCNPVILD